jgi:hypothetical protein
MLASQGAGRVPLRSINVAACAGSTILPRQRQEDGMRKTTFVAGIVAAAVIGFVGAGYAQPYGPGWMMGGGYGPGWMMHGHGPGMMGGGYGPGGMMGGPGWGEGHGPGWMHGYGPGYARDLNLSADDVKNYLEQTMQNPRLKVGEVTQTDDNTITATIVTRDKEAVVEKFAVNRHNGSWRPQND